MKENPQAMDQTQVGRTGPLDEGTKRSSTFDLYIKYHEGAKQVDIKFSFKFNYSG